MFVSSPGTADIPESADPTSGYKLIFGFIYSPSKSDLDDI